MKQLAATGAALRFVAPLIFSCSPAMALITFDDGHDSFFVNASAGVAYDSNIFATADGAGDTSFNASLTIEYKRKAGMIGVDADLGWQFSRFDKFSGESFANPELSAVFTKGTGRTTGAVTLSAKRESRAETAINIRAVSWNYDAGVQLKYPVIERYSISGGFDYNRRDFTSNAVLVDIDTYSLNADLAYALDSQRNLLAGYRYRTTRTTADTTDTDHAFTVGVSGKIYSTLNGSVRFGLQRRGVQRRSGPDTSHDSITANAAVTWTLSRRLKLIGALSRDFVTVATDANVDTTTASLDAEFAVNRKTEFFAGIAYNHLDFLDTSSTGRKDSSLSLTAGASYALTDHIKLSANYLYFINSSNVSISDYHRHSISFNVSSHW